MSYLEKLLDGARVEWVPLGEVAQYEQPTKYLVKTKNYSNEFDTPVLTAGKTFILGYTEETNDIYRASKKPVIIFDDFTTSNKWVDFDFKAKSSAMKIISSSDEGRFILKYVYYWLNTLPNDLADGDHKRRWISNFASKLIPIPCPENPQKSLAIQGEIVRILDKFTASTLELQRELEKELGLRKKQYAYYRDKLLNLPPDDVTWKTLDETFHMRAGHHIPASKIRKIRDENHPYPCFGGNGIRGFVSTNSHDEECLLIGRQGALCGNIQRMRGKFYATEHAVVVTAKEGINMNWAFHMLTIMNLNQYASQSAQPGLAVGKIQSLKIPVPSLAEQMRIADILDRFETLTNALQEGLPREIELRQKQYEYYRDRLLNFPKHEGEEADNG